MAEIQKSELSNLKAKLKKLECEIEATDKKERDIREKLKNLKKDRPTTEDLTVTFVKEIEKAKQYFKFKDYLKEDNEFVKRDSDKFDSFKAIVKAKVHRIYSKLDFADIMDAIQCESSIATLSEKGAPPSEQDYGCALLDPLKELVHRMKNGYTLKENPLDEVGDIMKKDMLFYYQIFIWKLFEKVSATKVIVRNLPEDFGVDEVKKLLVECGDVMSVSFTSAGLFGKHAYVTFLNSESAKLAPILMKQKLYTVTPLPELGEHEPDFSSSTEYEEALNKYAEFGEHEPNFPSSTEYEEALNKYAEFRRNKDKK